MKVIDLLNKIANNEIKDGTKFIFKNHSGFFNGKTKRLYLNINGTVDLIRYDGLKILNDEIEIIEEPKEELEEIELLSMHLEDSYVMFENAYATINKLIANQNKIIRELKANKKQ